MGKGWERNIALLYQAEECSLWSVMEVVDDAISYGHKQQTWWHKTVTPLKPIYAGTFQNITTVWSCWYIRRRWDYKGWCMHRPAAFFNADVADFDSNIWIEFTTDNRDTHSWLPAPRTFSSWQNGVRNYAITVSQLNKQTNSVAFSPQANYTDWATATCRRNLVPTFVDRGVSRGQRGGSLTVVNLSFLDRTRFLNCKT
jgi:hypothetical protein